MTINSPYEARGQRDLITVVGHAPMIIAGEFVQISGTWVNDRTHGQQFRASFLKASPPTTLEGIERYVASGMIRGIGPIYAKRLVRAFGEAVFDLIEQQPAQGHMSASTTSRRSITRHSWEFATEPYILPSAAVAFGAVAKWSPLPQVLKELPEQASPKTNRRPSSQIGMQPE